MNQTTHRSAARVLRYIRDGSLYKIRLYQHRGIIDPDSRGVGHKPNGDLYVTDGYANARLVKFSYDGKYLVE
jgi:hypothetical protein